jgi:hypothetical protein
MELFKIFGTIAINNSEANEAIDRTTDKAERSRYKMSQAFGKLGDAAIKAGKVIANGLAIGATAMAGLSVKALKLGGELEQNMGGSVAVFGDSAEEMQKKASEAFDKMGLSASDYLATANKMGALFKGAGFSVETSVDMTTRAMQRAADVASIMGIDTVSAMEAIAGAAKGNFTMMDNLGVAMNDTSLEAYALSKGITKNVSDMTQQEKIGLAMEMFLEKTAYAAGNYAKENDTLAGSLATAKAALANFLSGAGDAESLADALVNASDVIVDKAQSLLPRLVKGLKTLVEELWPEFYASGSTLLEKIVSGFVENFPRLVTASVAMVEKIATELTEEDTLDRLLDASLAIIMKIVEGLFINIPKLVTSAGRVIKNFVDYLLKKDNIEKIVSAGGEIIGQLAVGILNAIVTFAKTWEEIRQDIVESIMEIDWIQLGRDLMESIGEGLKDAWAEFQKENGSLAYWLSAFFNPKTRSYDFFVNGVDSASGRVNGSHADGLDYVPYDGYIAELHKGEMVIPADESARIRASSAYAFTASAGADNKGAALEQYFQKLIEMLSDYFPQIVHGMDRPIAFNPNSMAAALAVPMNQELGRISARKDRGR